MSRWCVVVVVCVVAHCTSSAFGYHVSAICACWCARIWLSCRTGWLPRVNMRCRWCGVAGGVACPTVVSCSCRRISVLGALYH
eukprot:5394047-Prorocentrum_lima.AAC.1